VSTATVDGGLGRVLTPKERLEKDDAGHESVDLSHMRHTHQPTPATSAFSRTSVNARSRLFSLPYGTATGVPAGFLRNPASQGPTPIPIVLPHQIEKGQHGVLDVRTAFGQDAQRLMGPH
jgi:hypothetical protein